MSDRDFCGIVFIGGGSSWAWAATPEEAAELAAKITRKDWGKTLELPVEVTVAVIDGREIPGWYSMEPGIVRNSQTGERIPIYKWIRVPKPKRAQKNSAAVALGKITSPAKAAAARENGRKGGRPRKDKGV